MKTLSLSVAVCLAFAWQSADASAYRLVHAFEGGKNDGRTPTIESSLTPSGTLLYGVTLDGGQYTNGVVFQIGTNGSGMKILHNFNGWSDSNIHGSKADGANPIGTPVLAGSTLYGMTEQGGSNGASYGLGSLYSVNTDGSGFQVLHNFGALNDGDTPQGSLIVSGSTLYGMTSAGGTNGISEGIIFSIQTNGTGYQILHSFINEGAGPQGSLILWGDTLYGMTQGQVFRVNTDGSAYLPVHVFTGSTTDGASAYGSLTRQGAYLYGMTLSGGANNVGTIFQIYLIASVFNLLHSFSTSEAFNPHGDLALAGSTLYGMSYGGYTNYGRVGPLGSGAVFQINTNGSSYQVLHTFEFPLTPDDGSLPFGTPIVLGSELYGMTSLGGSSGAPIGSTDGGCIFALSIVPSDANQAPTITTAAALPNAKVDSAYSQQLAATGGESPYTWTLDSGHLPRGLTLKSSGLLSGKPTTGEVADFTIKVTAQNKLSSTQAFSLAIEAPPTLTIISPKTSAKVTTATLEVSGTAAGVGALTGVYFQLNGGTWTKAQSSDGYTHWNYPNLPLQADTNVFAAYAVDASANYSTTDTVKFIYYVTTLLTVRTNGQGSVTPNDNAKALQVGGMDTITAKPAKGYVFTDWTNGAGDILSESPTLKFVMVSNLTLVANFVLAPKPTLISTSGDYVGLFAPTDVARQNSNSGAIRLSLTSSGAYSGQLLLGPDTLPFSGGFDADGGARLLLARKSENILTATLQLDSTGSSLTGVVTDGQFVAPLKAFREAFDAAHPATNYEGRYAVSFQWKDDAGTETAQGSGSVVVTESGKVTLTGLLPDGTVITQSSMVSGEGYWPLYLSLDGGRGSFWAWSRIANGTITSASQRADWIVPGKDLEESPQVNTSIQLRGTQQSVISN